MARFKSSTFGQISGKHGDAVAAVRKDGTCILKVYRVASNPNTVGQKNQRGKFGFVMKELNCLRKVFTCTYGGQYGINKAVSQAIKSAVSGDHPNFVLNFSKLLIAPNIFNRPLNCNLMKIVPNTIRITWDSAFFAENLQKSMVNIVVIQPDNKQVMLYENIVRFNAEFVRIELPDVLKDNKVHIWMYLSPNISTAIIGQYLNCVNKFSISNT